ncbi:MAG: DUF3850 domain-containing protein [Candidatus Saccharibacteria bacterium]
MNKTIEKKVRSKYFTEIEAGRKTFELRLADWDCQMGDTLILIETDNETNTPTGRTMRRTVGDIARTKDIDYFTPEDIEKYGYQIISLIDEK